MVLEGLFILWEARVHNNKNSIVIPLPSSCVCVLPWWFFYRKLRHKKNSAISDLFGDVIGGAALICCGGRKELKNTKTMAGTQDN